MDVGVGSRRLRPGAVLAAFVGAWAIACNLAIEVLQRVPFGTGPSSGVLGVCRFLLGALVLGLVLATLVAATGRAWVSAGCLAAASVGVGLVNALKLQLRFEPVYPADLGMVSHAGSLADMVGRGAVLVLVLLVAATLAVVYLVKRITHTTMPRVAAALSSGSGRRALLWRTLVCVVCALALLDTAAFQSPDNPWRRLYTLTGARWGGSAQAATYLYDGFVGATLSQLDQHAMSRPAGYSEQRMKAILARYGALARRTDAHRSGTVLDHLNVVVVLSESFTDPLRLRGATPQTDPIPYTRALMRRTTSGSMLAAGYGGGTANMEFETLTGLSMSQLRSSVAYPYSTIVASQPHFLSAVDYFRDHGYSTVAVHPYTAAFYSRDRAYAALGFDRFVTADDMVVKQRLGDTDFVSDDSAFREVERQIHQHPNPTFVHLVTIQNHGLYGGRYADPIPFRGDIGAAANEAGSYARGLAYTDAAVKRFLRALSRSGEPTAVVFFGDHQPGIWPGPVVRESGSRLMHETPFWIWSNVAGQATQHLPTTSPVYFMPLLLDQVHAPIPPFYALLDALRTQVSALDAGLLLDGQGRPISPPELTPRARRLLEDYRLVEYDLTEGRHYIAKGLFETP